MQAPNCTTPFRQGPTHEQLLRKEQLRQYPQLHPESPIVADGFRPRIGVEYGCGDMSCADCYEPITTPTAHLVPCPRCGHPAQRVEAPNEESYISCGHCGAMTFGPTGEELTMDEVVELAWDKRHVPLPDEERYGHRTSTPMINPPPCPDFQEALSATEFNAQAKPPVFVCGACRTTDHGPSAMQPNICYECANAWLWGCESRLDPNYTHVDFPHSKPAPACVSWNSRHAVMTTTEALRLALNHGVTEETRPLLLAALEAADKQTSTPTPIEACEAIENIAGWFLSFYNDVMATMPEYAELCGDLNALTYLISEAQREQEKARAALEAADQEALTRAEQLTAARKHAGQTWERWQEERAAGMPF